jgi:uncharacterized protein YbaP (TraB family)
MKDSKELWLELAMGSDTQAFALKLLPAMMKYGLSPGRPLSSLLTADENKALTDTIAKSKLPPATAQVLNIMKPWFATAVLGMSPLMEAGYDPSAGIDSNLAKIAEDDGDAINGLEDAEEQFAILAGASEEDQLKALRALLSAPPEAMEAEKKMSEAAFTAWAKGDIAPMEGMVAAMYLAAAAGHGEVDMDNLLKNRNEHWAQEIETMLKGAGVSFIAVGAAHLVGPDSVFARLKARGIEAKRY